METEEEMSLSEAMKMCQTALDVIVKSGYSGYVVSIFGNISVRYHTNEASKDKSMTATECSKVKTKLCKIGGPQEVDNFSAWKQGLSK